MVYSTYNIYLFCILISKIHNPMRNGYFYFFWWSHMRNASFIRFVVWTWNYFWILICYVTSEKEKSNYHLLFLFSFLAIRMGHIWIIIPSNIKERNVFSLSNIERPKLFIENCGHPRHPLCPTKFILQYLRFTRKEYPIFIVFYGHNAVYCSIFSHALFSFPRPLQFS